MKDNRQVYLALSRAVSAPSADDGATERALAALGGELAADWAALYLNPEGGGPPQLRQRWASEGQRGFHDAPPDAALAWLLKLSPPTDASAPAPTLDGPSLPFAALPIALHGRWGALLIIDHPADRAPWGAEDRELLTLAGEMLGAALDRDQQACAAQVALANRLRASVDAISHLIPIEDLDDLLREAVAAAHTTLGVERCEIHLEQAGHLCGTFTAEPSGQITDQRGMIVPIEIFWGERGEPAPPLGGQGRLYPSLSPHSAWEAITPIESGGRAVGIMLSSSPSGAPPDPTQQQALSAYCAALGPLISRSYTTAAATQRDRHYRTLVETSPDGIALITADGRIERANDMLAQLYGRGAADELIGASIRDLITPDQLMSLTDAPRRVDMILTREDGTQRNAEISVGAIRRQDGTLQGLVVVTRDVTDRAQAQAALRDAYTSVSTLNTELRRSRDVLRTLFDGLSDGLMLLDASGHVLAINRALASLTQSEPAQLIGRRWDAVCGPGELSALRLQIDTFADGARQSRRIRLEHPSRSPAMLDLQAFPLLESEGRVDQVVAHVTDITQRLQLETRMLEVERFAASGRLAATVAHEVNTPLQSIQSFLYLLRSGPAAKRAIYHDLIRTEITRIAEIISQLLDLYRPSVVAIGPVDLNMLVDRVLLLNGHQISKNRIRVRRELADDLPLAHGRADQIVQLLVNLVINASQAMPSGGELTIATECRAEGLVTLRVSDTGSGIDPALIERIFEPFFTTKPDGTGLGLSICQQIMAEHGGRLEVHSAPEGGTTFTATFPQRADAHEIHADSP